MKRIQSKKHETRIYWVNKTSLSCFGDKRYALDYGVHTLAYFHKDLKILRDSHRKEKILTDSHRKEKVLRDRKRFWQKRKDSQR